MELYDYQVTGLAEIYEAFYRVRRVLYTLPTGAGKTVVAVHAILNELDDEGQALFLAHRIELVDQAFARLVRWDLDRRDVGTIASKDDRSNPEAPVQIASIQTLALRDVEFEPTLIVVDEAHHAPAETYRAILERWPKAKILGITATPFRLNGKGLAEDFDELVVGGEPSELIADGYLAAPKTYTAPEGSLPQLQDVKKVGGDFHQGELSKASNRPHIVGGIVSEWKRLANNRTTVVYAVDLPHAKSIRDAFRDGGVEVGYIDGKTPTDERATTLKALRTKKIKVVVNVGVLTEGWDFPDLECVVLARPTYSLGLYLQMVGRCMRKGRVRPLVLDHAGNALLHGLAQEDREYTLEGVVRGSGRGGPMCKRCECGETVPIAMQVHEECGHVFWTKESGPPPEVAALLEEAKPRQTHCAGYPGRETPCDKVPTAEKIRKAKGRHKKKGLGDGLWRCSECGLRKRSQNPEWRAKHAEAMRKMTQNPEWRAKNAEAARKMTQNPEWRAKHAEATRKRSQNPEWRAKNAEAARKMTQNPEWRAKMSEVAKKREESKRVKRKTEEDERAA